MFNIVPVRVLDQPQRLQLVERTRSRRNLEPVVPSVRAGIFGQWLNGEPESRLASRYGVRVECIRSVAREESRKLRDELRMRRVA